jgi:hypothetical protein
MVCAIVKPPFFPIEKSFYSMTGALKGFLRVSSSSGWYNSICDNSPNMMNRTINNAFPLIYAKTATVVTVAISIPVSYENETTSGEIRKPLIKSDMRIAKGIDGYVLFLILTGAFPSGTAPHCKTVPLENHQAGRVS